MQADTSRSDVKIEVEVEADKENITPAISVVSPSSSRVARNRSKQRSKHVQSGALLPPKKRARVLVAINALDRGEASNHSSGAVADSSSRNLSTSAKRESTANEKANSRDHYTSVMTSRIDTNQPVQRIPTGTLQLDKVDARREAKTSCVSSPSGDQTESNKNKCNLTVSCDNSRDESSRVDTKDEDTKTAATASSSSSLSSSVENESIILEVAEETQPEEAQTARVDVTCNRGKSKNSGFAKISQLISEEQKFAIETGYNVDMALMNNERLEKNMTVLGKKGIKCNICQANYSRMDKCKVNILH